MAKHASTNLPVKTLKSKEIQKTFCISLLAGLRFYLKFYKMCVSCFLLKPLMALGIKKIFSKATEILSTCCVCQSPIIRY